MYGAIATQAKADVTATSNVYRVMFAFTLPLLTSCRSCADHATDFALTFGKSMSVCATLLT